MAQRLPKTLVDYLVIAISPALIMALVGSLVLFLIEVFYQGNFHGRLQYIFVLFVIATVLIGRISIEEGRERAGLFAVPLGMVTLLAINKFVEFQGGVSASLSLAINCGLMALIWWSADKLTWDCTLIDESEEDPGEGLLEAVGLDRPGKAALEEEIATPAAPEATTSPKEPVMSRWERFLERRRRPHACGVWVVYFSMAAVALFGIGQVFMPRDDLAKRQYAFHLLCVYTASGLGLLLSTSFLGLRRYLRQRRQTMPLVMVNLWLVVGAILIGGVMLSTMLLPRPNSEYAVSEPPFRFGSPDQRPSPHGMGSDPVKAPQASQHDSGRENQPGGPVPSDRHGGQASEDPGKRPQDGKSSAKTEEDQSHLSPEKGKGSEEKSSSSDKSRATQDQSATTEASQVKQDSKRDSRQDSPRDGAGDAKQSSHEDRGRQERSERASETRPPAVEFRPMPQDPGGFFSEAWVKWLLYGLMALVVAVAIWWHRAELLAALRTLWQELLDLWHRLFGGRGDRGDGASKDTESARGRLRRFADFADPFATGLATAWPPEKLVRYIFEAFEAWAAEHGHPRQPEETPNELARRLALDMPSLADDAGWLADLYCQAAYASGMASAVNLDRLSRLWQNLAMSQELAVEPGEKPGGR